MAEGDRGGGLETDVLPNLGGGSKVPQSPEHWTDGPLVDSSWLENRLQERCQVHLCPFVFCDKAYSLSFFMVILKETVITIEVKSPPFNSRLYDHMECVWDLPLPLKSEATEPHSSLPALCCPCSMAGSHLLHMWVCGITLAKIGLRPSVVPHATEHFERKHQWERFFTNLLITLRNEFCTMC